MKTPNRMCLCRVLISGMLQVILLNVFIASEEAALTSGPMTIPTTRKPLSRQEIYARAICRSSCRGKPCEVDFSTDRPVPTCYCHPPCLHEAQCVDGVCQCPPGYSGPDCGIPDPNMTCSSLDCANGGHCRDYGLEGQHCSCVGNFSGRTCQTSFSNVQAWCMEECGKRNHTCKPYTYNGEVISFQCITGCRKANRCQHGYCEDNSTNDCICEECWNGKLCNFRCCKKCLNGGRCIKVGEEEKCDCPVSPEWYEGDRCQSIRKRETALTSGTMTIPTTRKPLSRQEIYARTICRSSCRGKPCEVDFSTDRPVPTCYCHPPCLHEAQCVDGVCQCPPGYSGPDCGIPDPNMTCSSLDCANGGHCRDYGLEGQHCSCVGNFSGRTCQTSFSNVQAWCMEECGKRNHTCKPYTYNGEVISFQCITGCRKAIGCQHGYCEDNSTNDCICEECWNGKFCNFHCCKKCLNGGRCIKVGEGEKCDCPVSPEWYEGDRCQSIRKPSTTKPAEILAPEYKYILGASGGVLLLLLAALAILPYVLWKKRVLWVMKIVYKFQSPVEVGEREFHAFVSYSGSKVDGRQSPDEQFVLQKLQKILEGEYNFRLCLHYRDFIPGIAIAENIIHAVEKSQRTILVLSRRFVESEWCQLEYQKAQHEMLMRRHKIIPIMFEPIDQVDINDTNLLDILKAVTYIVWPGDDANPKKQKHFWKKIIYSMPKKGGNCGSAEETELADLEHAVQDETNVNQI